MAKFAFAARSTAHAVVAALRAATGRPLAELKQHLANGTPFYATEDYDDDPDAFAEACSTIVDELQRLGVEPAIYRLDAGEDVDSDVSTKRPVSAEIMRNMIRRYADNRKQTAEDKRRELGDDE